MSTAISLEFESRILNTLDVCLGKMSESLERKFDPTDKPSMSLFRQFCSAVRIRLQWTKSLFNRIVQPATKNNENKKQENTQTKNSPMELPVTWDRIDEAVKNYPKTNHLLSSDTQKNGLLIKR